MVAAVWDVCILSVIVTVNDDAFIILHSCTY